MQKLNNDIERYLRGELSPAEMHALEQRALKDPFLAEALEGAEHAGAENFSHDIQMLQHSIREKSGKRKIRTITLNGWGMYMGIAAGLLMLVVSYFVIALLIKQDKKEDLAKASEVVSKDSKNESQSQLPKTDSLLALNETPSQPSESIERKAQKPSNRPSQPQQRPNIAAQPETQDEPQGEDRAVAELATPSPEENNAQPIEAEKESIADTDQQIAQSREETRESEKKAKRSEAPQATGAVDSSPAFKSGLLPVVKGRVVSAEDGNPLPGVNVLIKGTNKGTVTDAQGNYELPLTAENQSLVFSFIGLTSKEVEVDNKNEVNVSMESDVSQLSEMVITGYEGAGNPPTLEMAEPQGGRKAFQKYLEEQMAYPKQALENKVEGKVTIQFTVQPNGQLSDFQVLKSLGYGCDEEVIRLIKEGPAWRPSKKNNEPVKEKVKIRMKFDLPE